MVGVDRLIVLDTNPLRVRIVNAGRIIKIMNANFCVFDFYFSLEAMPEEPRSETLVAGLGSVLHVAAILRVQPAAIIYITVAGKMTRTLNPAVILMTRFTMKRFCSSR